jgi:hypothetical protein
MCCWDEGGGGFVTRVAFAGMSPAANTVPRMMLADGSVTVSENQINHYQHTTSELVNIFTGFSFQ